MRLRDELQWIKKHGIRAWLTWATVEEACELVPLRRSARFWRWAFRVVAGPAHRSEAENG